MSEVENVKTPEELKAEADQNLALWYQKAAQLKALKDEEMDLRNKVVQYFFPKGLKEGTTSTDMPEGWVLKAKGTINRKVELAVIPAITEELKELGIDIAEYIKYKPELDLPSYRGLQTLVEKTSGESNEHAKKVLATFDQVLIITDGSPALELVEPKKPKARVTKAGGN